MMTMMLRCSSMLNPPSFYEPGAADPGGAAASPFPCSSVVASSQHKTMGELPRHLCKIALKAHSVIIVKPTFSPYTRRSNSYRVCASTYLQPLLPTHCDFQIATALRTTPPTCRTPNINSWTRPRLSRSMSSDADYAAFLDKANQGTAQTEQQSPSKSYGTKSVNTAVPKALEQVEEYYTSDADEPFEPVALTFDGSSVNAGMYPAIAMNELRHGSMMLIRIQMTSSHSSEATRTLKRSNRRVSRASTRRLWMR